MKGSIIQRSLEIALQLSSPKVLSLRSKWPAPEKGDFFDWALIIFSGLNSHISLKRSYKIFHVNFGVPRLTLEWLHCLQEKYKCTLILIFTNQKIDSHVSSVHQLSIKHLVGAN